MWAAVTLNLTMQSTMGYVHWAPLIKDLEWAVAKAEAAERAARKESWHKWQGNQATSSMKGLHAIAKGRTKWVATTQGDGPDKTAIPHTRRVSKANPRAV